MSLKREEANNSLLILVYLLNYIDSRSACKICHSLGRYKSRLWNNEGIPWPEAGDPKARTKKLVIVFFYSPRYLPLSYSNSLWATFRAYIFSVFISTFHTIEFNWRVSKYPIIIASSKWRRHGFVKSFNSIFSLFS